jgi:predicted nucleic acid-binding protein
VVECESAIARRERDSTHTPAEAALARRRLESLASQWRDVDPVPTIRPLAQRLLRVHPLTAADALQLAAAITAAEGDASSLALVCLDGRLADAAGREGFRVVEI